MAKKTKEQGVLFDIINDNFDDHDGYDIEVSLQKKLKEHEEQKVGFNIIPQAKQADGFFHEWGFASEDDYDKFMQDQVTYASLRLYDNAIPISTDKGVSYSARLVCSEKTTNAVVAVEKTHVTGLRFSGLMNDNGVVENAGIIGTLTFQRSINNGSSWETVGTATITSRDQTDTTYDSYDIGQYFASTNPQQIRVRVSFSVYDDDGNLISSAVSAWVTWSNVTYTQLTVKNMQDWTRPIQAEDGVFPLSFAVGGAVEKWLHVRISGSSGDYTYVERMPAVTQYPETTPRTWTEAEKRNIGILTHGIHTVTAWVTCDDGSGHLGGDGYPDGLSSEVVVNRFMVVNTATEGADLTKPYLMLQQTQANVVNYVRVVLTNFAVWLPDSTDPTKPSSERLAVSVRLTDAGDGDTDYTTEYMRSEMNVENNTSYAVDTTVEIESTTSSTQITEYLAYLRIFRYAADNSVINFMYESVRQLFQTITVDNSEDYSPVAGAHFILNPKTRNNSEANRESIINQVNGQIVPSIFKGFDGVTDLWTEDSNGQKVLRVNAGEELNIIYEAFEQFKTDGRAKLTLDLDFAVRNITKEDEPAIDLCQVIETENPLTGEVTQEQLGLRMFPLEGNIKASGKQATNDQDFKWQEDTRTHISLVIDPAVIAKADDELTWQKTLNDNPSNPLSLAKVYINGYPNRDVDYTPNIGAWITGEGHGGLKIGNKNCDIDIYGIRCYRSALSAEQVRQNYVASLPTAEQKLKVKTANAITENGRISYAKAKQGGFRCLTLHGQDQYKLNQDKDNGYACYWSIDHDDPNLSGTIGKAAYLAYMNGTIGNKKCLMVTPQGSTANTYWDNNEQTKIDGITFIVNIPFSKVHADFGWKASMSDGDDCECPMYLDGNRIDGSRYASLSDEQKARVTIDVPDGWFDGNGWSESVAEMGMYHGQFYTSYIGGAKCTKVVNKINYASPMQSHKMGATRLYHDVMVGVTGGNSLTKAGARFSVYEESFLFFTEHPNDNGKVEYRGMCTFGNGKFDKAVFGLKKNDKTFAFEGLNNNLPLCDFRVPADEDVVYSPSDESWCYNGVKSFEYGLGKTKTVDGKKYPTDDADRIFRRYVNFIYSHTTSLVNYNGTKEKFMQEWDALQETAASDPETANTVAEMQTKQYWFTQGSDAFHLVRYDFVRDTWVDAGTWNQSQLTYASGVRDLSTYGMTAEAYINWRTGDDYGNFAKLNTMFIQAIAQHGADYFGTVAHVKNHQTHYNVVNFLLAGTDNCSKNLYYQIDPETGLVWLDQDDLDSILPTDNNGRQTKVYFLDRINDVADYENGYKPQIDYEGRASSLFNFMEVAYEQIGTGLRENMREVLQVMSGLVSSTDGYDISVWGCMEKYFFSIQEYFPQVAYAEQARLRYEWPKSFGYISFGNQARGVDPITQQVGNQLESEKQYMKRRLALVASYACWGDFSSGVNTGVVGLADSGSAISMSPGSGRVGTSYVFKLVPHQWLYPVATIDRAVADPHVRVAPGEEYTFDVLKQAGLSSVEGDSGVSLAASNYYRKLGNVGNMVVGNNTLSIPAKRLTDFVAEPATSGQFTPGTINLQTPNLQRLSLKGCSTMTGTKDYTALTRLEEIDLRSTAITIPLLPTSNQLSSVMLPATTTLLTLENMPNLSTVEIEGMGADIAEADRRSALQELTIGENVPVNSGALVKSIFSCPTKALRKLSVKGIKWTNVAAAMVTWMMTLQSCSLTGSMKLVETEDLPYSDVISLIDNYGDIQNKNNVLYVEYKKNTINSFVVRGDKYVKTTGLWNGWSVAVAPTRGNAVAIADGREAAKWTLSGEGVEEYAEMVDDVKGTVRVKQVQTTEHPTKFTLKVELTLTDGSTLSYEKSVGFANRIPRVGDFAYSDGTFDDEYDTSKNMVGAVVKRDVLEWRDNAQTIPSSCKLWVYAKENAVATSDDKTYNSDSHVWGTYPDNGNANGFSTAITDVIAQKAELASVTDTPMPNITTSGLTSPTDANNKDYRYIRDTYLDANRNDGYAVLTGGCMNDFDVENKNDIVIRHAKAIIGTLDQSVDSSLDSTYPTSLTDLANKMQALVAKMTENGVSSPARYRQLYYPAAYACYLYEPAVDDGEELNEQYKKNKWMLPTEGLLGRIYNFFYNSCGRITYESGGRCTADKANENPESEALLPLFANILARIAKATTGSPFAIPTNSYYWSVTEYSSLSAWYVYFYSGVYGTYKYGSGVVRPVAAFTFNL